MRRALDWQPGTNLLFETEHGPSGFDGPGGGDEVNIVEKGKNYGWPVIHHTQTRAGMEVAVVGIHAGVCAWQRHVLSWAAFPEFRGNFFFGCLRGRAHYSRELDGRRVVSQENLLEGSMAASAMSLKVRTVICTFQLQIKMAAGHRQPTTIESSGLCR